MLRRLKILHKVEPMAHNWLSTNHFPARVPLVVLNSIQSLTGLTRFNVYWITRVQSLWPMTAEAFNSILFFNFTRPACLFNTVKLQ